MLTLFPAQFYIPKKIVDEICWTEGTYCVSLEQSRPFSPFAPNVRTAPATTSPPACSANCPPWLLAPLPYRALEYPAGFGTRSVSPNCRRPPFILPQSNRVPP